MPQITRKCNKRKLHCYGQGVNMRNPDCTRTLDLGWMITSASVQHSVSGNNLPIISGKWETMKWMQCNRQPDSEWSSRAARFYGCNSLSGSKWGTENGRAMPRTINITHGRTKCVSSAECKLRFFFLFRSSAAGSEIEVLKPLPNGVQVEKLSASTIRCSLLSQRKCEGSADIQLAKRKFSRWQTNFI